MKRRITVESLSYVDVNRLNCLGAFACPMEYPFMGLRTSRNLIETDTGMHGKTYARLKAQAETIEHNFNSGRYLSTASVPKSKEICPQGIISPAHRAREARQIR